MEILWILMQGCWMLSNFFKCDLHHSCSHQFCHRNTMHFIGFKLWIKFAWNIWNLIVILELDLRLSGFLWLVMFALLAIVFTLPQLGLILLFVISVIFRLIFSVGIEITLILLGSLNVSKMFFFLNFKHYNKDFIDFFNLKFDNFVFIYSTYSLTYYMKVWYWNSIVTVRPTVFTHLYVMSRTAGFVDCCSC